MHKLFFLLLTFTFITFASKAQFKAIFNNNIAFKLPAEWYVKDSSDKRILLRKNGDLYSKIEIRIYDHKYKDLSQYITLNRKKLSPDKHTRTLLPDASIGGRVYKKIKYFNTNKVVIANTEVEHVAIFKPKFVIPKIANGRLEITLTCPNTQEIIFSKTVTDLIAQLKWQ